MTDTTSDPTPAVAIWPTVQYADARAAIAFLTDAFGFEATIVVPGDDESVVEHAQLRGPCGGGIMLGSAGREGNAFSQRPVGAASIYVVVDDPDGLHERAMAAGAGAFAPLVDQAYGGRGFSVTDPEGNIWSFGSYAGE